MSTMLPSEADAVARELTGGHMHVEADRQAVYLVNEVTHDKVRLLPYQMTPEGLEDAVGELWEPQNA